MSVKAISWAFEQDVKLSSKAVLIALADHADDAGWCWPGRRGIAKKLNISERTVSRHCAELEAKGLLARRPRFRKEGSQTSSLYKLPLPGSSSATPPLDVDDKGARQPRHPPLSVVTSLKPSVEPSEEPTSNHHVDESYIQAGQLAAVVSKTADRMKMK